MVADDGRVTDRLMDNAEKNTTYIIGKFIEYMQLIKYYALLIFQSSHLDAGKRNLPEEKMESNSLKYKTLNET